MDTPFITIIIPTFNNEECIMRSLGSAINQTLYNIEIIISDDNSEDNTIFFVKKIMRNDLRIRLLSSEKKEGIYLAKKKAVQDAKGEMILFLSADDEITEGLCEELFEAYKKEKADILYYSFGALNDETNKQLYENSEKCGMSIFQELSDTDVFMESLYKEKQEYNLNNKLFSTRLCKQIFMGFPDMRIDQEKDALCYFFLLLNAKNHMKVKTNNKYLYHIERRDIRKADFDIESFILKLVRKTLDICSKSLVLSFRNEGFKRIFQKFEIEDVIDSLYCLWNGQEEYIAKILPVEIINITEKKENKKIAVYYNRLRVGGAERVVSLLIPMYIKLGYEVILITEEEPHEMDYPIPASVTRYVISPGNLIDKGEVAYKQRAIDLKRIFIKEDVSIFCFNAASSPLLLYDLVLAKSIGVKVVAIKHEVFSQHMASNGDFLKWQLSVFPLLDRLVVLSRTEKLFWKTVGVNSIFIPNPNTLGKCKNAPKQTGYIVWVGRYDELQKQPYDAIHIMKRIVEYIPNALLKMYGVGENENEKELLELCIKKAGLEKSIICCGFEKEINNIYDGASIHLVTSAFESFSMNILESKTRGIPLVTYNMPYLEMLKEGKGSVIVEQRDYDGAALAIIELLTDKKKYIQFSKEASESISFLKGTIVEHGWKDLFDKISEENEESIDYEKNEYSTILKTMAFHYSLGRQRADKIINNNEKIKRELVLKSIKLLMLENKLKVAIYPFGIMGKKVKNFLENNNIIVDAIFDNNPDKTDRLICPLNELTKEKSKEYLFVICSNRISIHKELLDALYEKVDGENIYDLFPIDNFDIIKEF